MGQTHSDTWAEQNDSAHTNGASDPLGAVKKEAANAQSNIEREIAAFADSKKHDVSSVLRTMSDGLKSGSTGNRAADVDAGDARILADPLSRLLDTAADTIDRTDLNRTGQRIRQIAAEQPVVVAVGAAAIGLLLSRALKSRS